MTITYKTYFIPYDEVSDDWTTATGIKDAYASYDDDWGFHICHGGDDISGAALKPLLDYYRDTFDELDHWVPGYNGLYLMCEKGCEVC